MARLAPRPARFRPWAETLEAREVPAMIACQLGDFVWHDLNKDGVQQAGEPGINGVQVSLYADGVIQQTKTTLKSSLAGGTAKDGFYQFYGLEPGVEYVVCFGTPSGFTRTAQFAGGNTATDSNMDIVTGCAPGVTFGPTGGSNQTIDAGFYKCPGNTVDRGDTATIGFWQNKNGQALIKSLNGGSSATNLGNWLASSFPNLFGAGSYVANTTGMTNLQVANLFKTVFTGDSPKVEAQTMAVALAVYVTDSDLAGTAARKYGFDVSATGTGGKLYNVGNYGSEIGLTDNTSYTVMALLQQADAQAGLGTFDRNAFNNIFSDINETGDII
ncbi:MAG TPA: SdrD B-like domain-containing protein [Gemmataceae bacterium]|nr:SdrD B-like domain-containing protein [Gemmataceae bacterium]